MAAAELVCLQTYSYSRHFVSMCVRVCGYESSPHGIDAEGHVATVAHCPVGGICSLRPGIQPKLAALRAFYEGKISVLCVPVAVGVGCRGRAE
ncbi:hypothetical protein B0H16DRAFT_1524516 [Mycena metata]|uniref:Uncharacterized protein n=1 Tax=Mycena metata TaxID=1033252 RepID=A0AAD7DW24_9AGAR|nr:hypothetical protein B0H16DRAFT_1642269 [Mycena metata]KAJ7765166.1 hypothetical protein B0H16DRAFT_1524516 [Mycena metata]